MDKIIDTFYNGSIRNNGYNKSRLTSNKFSSPNLLENRYNRINLNINDNQRYKNGQRIMNTPIPRTNYSMGLNVPTITGHPPMNQSTTLPYPNNDTNTYSFLQKNYPDNILKMHILDNRIKQMEDENKRDKLKIQRLLEGSTFAPDDNQFNSINNNFNRTYINNPSSLQQAMDNLRNQYLTLDEISQKQAMRREQVQLELDKARQKLNEERMEKERERIIRNQKREKNYTISNYSEDSEGKDDEEESKSQSYESYSKTNNYTNYSKNSSNKNHTHYTNRHDYNDEKYEKLKRKIKKKEKEINDIQDNLNQVIHQNNYNNEEINQLRIQNEEMYNALKSKEESEDFINSIPDHVALQLQNDNFKIRSNLASIKEGFKEIKNELENKLEALQMKQNMNFEVIRKIIEEGGNKKTNAGLRKYLDGEDVDLNNIEEDLPDYLKYLPALIEKKIQENDAKRKEEQNKQINEEINKKYDMMEYKYGYANSFYDYKNNYKPTIVQNKNNNPNFVISKNYGRYQYIAPNNKNTKKSYNSFRQNAENNLKIIKEKENMIAGRYAYGVGDKNMNRGIPIKMNGCFDDWYKTKKNGDKKYDGEFQIENSISEENKNKELVGINAIKKRVNSKSNKTESKSYKSKESKKNKNKNKSEVSESMSVSVSKTKSSKASKVSKKTKSSKSKKESENDKKDKKEDKKKEKEKKKNNKNNKKSEEENEEDDNKEENEEDDDDNDNNEDKDGSNSNEDNEENEEDKESSGKNDEENNDDDDNEEKSGSDSGDDNEKNGGSDSGDDNEENSDDDNEKNSDDDNEENSGSGSGDDNEENSGDDNEENSGDDNEENSGKDKKNKSSDESSSN